GLQAAVELQESGGGLQPPGGTLSLLCKASGFTFSSFGMGWVRQGSQGKGLEWVGSSPGRLPSSFLDRCSISRDDSQASLRLQLSSLQEQDSATYYCAKAAG
ncbi:HV323 protein, partial [Indicator maculatus]|nr:HV323 protein [Indicator maculatus]